MEIMQLGRMKQDLNPERWDAFNVALEKFYASLPADLTILPDGVTVDWSGSFTLPLGSQYGTVRRNQQVICPLHRIRGV